MTPLSEFDKRQLKLMLEEIISYEKGERNLRRLIGALEALQGVLEGMMPSWHDDFAAKWGILEDVYSGVVVHKEGQLDDKDREAIASALEQMKAMIDVQLTHSYRP